jgi:HAD superfamily hydrolase (TIGR01509 family)
LLPVSVWSQMKMPAVLFDLDGTLIDSVYAHVGTWSVALREAGIAIPAWKIHRHIGMNGKHLIAQLLRELEALPKRKPNFMGLEKRHDALFGKRISTLAALLGANELLEHLTANEIRWAIATAGNRKHTMLLLKHLQIPKNVPVVTGEDVANAKPSPDVFVLAAQRLGVSMTDSIVVGDSIWDLLAAGRKKALGVGLLSGGYGQAELEGAGAFRVYADPAELLAHIEDLVIPGV